MKIGKRKIGKNFPVFIIAEAGVNYNNNLKLAYKMVDVAVKAKVDAIKFQTFVAEKVQLKSAPKPNYQKFMKNKSYFEILKSNEPSFDDHKKISNYCKRKGILFLSTPADLESVDFLDELGMPAYKISSSDTQNHILIRKVLEKNKPIILSTGLSTDKEVLETVNFIAKLKKKYNLVLLQATSDYPTPNSEVNLRVISKYQRKFKVLVGLSDHTEDFTASLGAVALGACMLEKHFTLSRKLKGVDQSSSLEPHELVEWVKKVRLLEESLGSEKKFVTNSEKQNISMRKKLVICSIKKYDRITINHLEAKRGTLNGIPPTEKNVKKILGKKINQTIKNEKQFSWKMIQ